MWNDEDNNPYGTSFDRRDSQTSSSLNPASPTSPTSHDCEPAPARAFPFPGSVSGCLDRRTDDANHLSSPSRPHRSRAHSYLDER